MHGSFCSIFLTFFSHIPPRYPCWYYHVVDIYTSQPMVACVVNVVHPSFPMMTITSSMMMLMSCLVYPVSAEVQFWPVALYGAWLCRAGWGAGGIVKSRIASSALFLSLRDHVCFCCSCSGMNHTAPQGSILGTDFLVGDINVEACEGILKGVLEAFLLPTNWSFSVAELTIIRAVLAGSHHASECITWPAHITCAFCGRVWMIWIPARVRTSVSGTMSCPLMHRIIRKHFVLKWLSFLAWRMCTVYDSHAHSRTVSTTAMNTFSLVSWLIPRRSHTFFLSLPNAELALESMLLTSTPMLASLERVLPR